MQTDEHDLEWAPHPPYAACSHFNTINSHHTTSRLPVLCCNPATVQTNLHPSGNFHTLFAFPRLPSPHFLLLAHHYTSTFSGEDINNQKTTLPAAMLNVSTRLFPLLPSLNLQVQVLQWMTVLLGVQHPLLSHRISLMDCTCLFCIIFSSLLSQCYRYKDAIWIIILK